MSLYLDLIPPPQFEQSLTSYTVGNFQRIKDILVRASGRVYVTSGNLVGPWPNSVAVNIPFKCDILYSVSVSLITTAVALLAMNTLIDGTNVGFCEQWASETSTHKTFTGFFTIRGVSAGSHTFGTSYGTGGLTSDSNDRFKFGLTCVEV